MSEDNKKQGYIRVYRSIRNQWIWNNPETLKAWLDILLETNHAERKVYIKGKLYVVKRGQSINSLRTWASRWGWSINRVRRFFKCLTDDTMLNTETDTATTIITVLNYDTYQFPSNEADTATDTQKKNKRKSNGNQTETNKELKELKELKEEQKTASPKLQVLPFQSEKFRDSWEEWKTYRKEIKKPLTATAIKRQFNALEKMGEENSIASITESICNGWTGLFEPKKNKGTKKTTQQREQWRNAL